MHKVRRFNDGFALAITKAVSTMWCAYVFAAIAFVTLPSAIRGGATTLVPWIAQTFLQLVLLSIIMVGQQLQAQQTIDLHSKIDDAHDKLDAVHDHLGIVK